MAEFDEGLHKGFLWRKSNVFCHKDSCFRIISYYCSLKGGLIMTKKTKSLVLEDWTEDEEKQAFLCTSKNNAAKMFSKVIQSIF